MSVDRRKKKCESTDLSIQDGASVTDYDSTHSSQTSSVSSQSSTVQNQDTIVELEGPEREEINSSVVSEDLQMSSIRNRSRTVHILSNIDEESQTDEEEDKKYILSKVKRYLEKENFHCTSSDDVRPGQPEMSSRANLISAALWVIIIVFTTDQENSMFVYEENVALYNAVSTNYRNLVYLLLPEVDSIVAKGVSFFCLSFQDTSWKQPLKHIIQQEPERFTGKSFNSLCYQLQLLASDGWFKTVKSLPGSLWARNEFSSTLTWRLEEEEQYVECKFQQRNNVIELVSKVTIKKNSSDAERAQDASIDWRHVDRVSPRVDPPMLVLATVLTIGVICSAGITWLVLAVLFVNRRSIPLYVNCANTAVIVMSLAVVCFQNLCGYLLRSERSKYRRAYEIVVLLVLTVIQIINLNVIWDILNILGESFMFTVIAILYVFSFELDEPIAAVKMYVITFLTLCSSAFCFFFIPIGYKSANISFKVTLVVIILFTVVFFPVIRFLVRGCESCIRKRKQKEIFLRVKPCVYIGFVVLAVIPAFATPYECLAVSDTNVTTSCQE